ncbi:MAG: phosphoribosylamine--glycine ligase [Flavobacteriaceae bacterium CG_4_8_14_3_um_filter_34_10]|nr:MAG: phosphoribosylamine--glycine ligase [Flavobacteriaceae bacterium CG2_30_34_30]PIQ18434.1 MAG: phosphoribosylamine--glycine ligase [Flavobacteriaceae bacterium CG18_big_fil_WC_8_21_14_2_50_34_36]PIV48793.1 MAG: phosphoribosylamine--glycine ligase [Flavobacteriaceae bacterium CG02_land_8_20_14_3_00_34_13]PIX09219.1 MAG: phosphoribosylamine--glycine ligase [Flavobacteriaceae bacterium CG_4_8_14_3_um_filter_34_10]PIZ08669.1 MAG: phosphoribosylamine--glycine ligase [Flavobacteriaceae bacteri
MNILILGSGGREHTFAWKIAQSPLCSALFVAPGNAGTSQIATNVAIQVIDFEAIKHFVVSTKINMVVVGPEDPLVLGIYDFFSKDPALKEVILIGPSKHGAQLEGSKEFAKKFMQRHDIPTAAYRSFSKETIQDGLAYLENAKAPYVLKADGLAAGKGVVILEDLEEAKTELKSMLLDEKFGAASKTVVIEQFLKGIELSVFVLTDGKNYLTLPTAKDYKRIGEGDKGLNTGGMGAVSPVSFVDEAFMQKIENTIIIPTINGLKKDAITYKGFVFIGLIKVEDEPYVIEYNVRMGDPETEVVLPRIKTDIVRLLEATAKGTLNTISLEIDSRAATTVMLVSGGYPEAYDKGIQITGIENTEGSVVFHAGTTKKDGKIVTNGGRVLAVTSLDEDYKKALKKSYQNITKIHFEKMNYRKDIGFDL